MRQIFQKNRRLSIQRASATLSICCPTVNRILRRFLQLQAYWVQNLHLLSAKDQENKLKFAYYCWNHLGGYSNVLSKTLFTDECMARLNGSVNTQKVRIWWTVRPSERKKASVHCPGYCMVRHIALYWAESEKVSADSYECILSKNCSPNLRLFEREYVFQQDGAGQHRASSVRAHLDKKLDDYWIGRKGPIDWPARSLCLSLCNFFVGLHQRKGRYRAFFSRRAGKDNC